MTLYSTIQPFESTRADTCALMRANPRILFAHLPQLRKETLTALQAVIHSAPEQVIASPQLIAQYNTMVQRLRALPTTLLRVSAEHESRAASLSSAGQVSAAEAHLRGGLRVRVSPLRAGEVSTQTLPRRVTSGRVDLGGKIYEFGATGTYVTADAVLAQLPTARREVVWRYEGRGLIDEATPLQYPCVLRVAKEGVAPLLLKSPADRTAAQIILGNAAPAPWAFCQERVKIAHAGGVALGEFIEGLSNVAHISADVDVGDFINDVRVTAVTGTTVTLTQPISAGEHTLQYGGYRVWAQLRDTLTELTQPARVSDAIDVLLRAENVYAAAAAIPAHTVGGRALALVDKVTRVHRSIGADIALHQLQRCAIDVYATLSNTAASSAAVSAHTADLLR